MDTGNMESKNKNGKAIKGLILGFIIIALSIIFLEVFSNISRTVGKEENPGLLEHKQIHLNQILLNVQIDAGRNLSGLVNRPGSEVFN